MSNNDTNQQWDLYTSGATVPLLRIIELWATEDGVKKDEIIKRLATLLNQTNEYLMVWKNLTIPDPTVASLLQKVLKSKTWKDIGSEAWDKDLLKRVHHGNRKPDSGRISKLAIKLDETRKEFLLAKDLSVDCDVLFEVI